MNRSMPLRIEDREEVLKDGLTSATSFLSTHLAAAGQHLFANSRFSHYRFVYASGESITSLTWRNTILT